MPKNTLCSILFALTVFVGLTGQTWRQGDHQDRREHSDRVDYGHSRYSGRDHIRAVHPNDGEWRHRGHHWRPRYNYYQNGYHIYPYMYAPTVYMSSSYTPVTYTGGTYYYDQGVFYQDLGTSGYAAVPPPVGAVVSTLPTGSIQISSRGETYYIFNQVYYKQVPQGYQVVEPVR